MFLHTLNTIIDTLERLQTLTQPYQNNFEGQNGDKLLKEICLIELTQATEDFIVDYISQVEDVYHFQHHRLDTFTAKDKIPEKCRIGGNCFTSDAIVGGKLFTSNSKHLNQLHKEHIDLVSAIITLGVNVDDGDNISIMV